MEMSDSGSPKKKPFDKYERLGAYHWDGGSKDPYYRRHIEFIQNIFVQARSNYGQNLILDIGCGDGFITKQLADLGFDVFGIDTNGYALHLAREKFSTLQTRGKARFANLNFFDLKETPGFMLISDVLEHVSSPIKFVSHLFSLNPLVVVISTPLARQDGKLWDPGYHVTEFSKEGFLQLFSCFRKEYAITHLARGQLQSEYTVQYMILAKKLEILSLPFNYGLGLIRKKGGSESGVIHDRFFKKPEATLNGVHKKAADANALKSILKAIQKNPLNPVLFNNLGTLLAHDKPDQAIVCFKKALLINPDYAEADNNLSAALKRQEHPGRPAEGIKKESEFL